MPHTLRSLFKSLLALLSVGSVCLAAEPAASNSNARIVFIGDSITGHGGGYVFKMREALSAVYPGGYHELVPLGGSGMGVDAWLSVLKDEAKQRQDLDVKGVQVATALSQPAGTAAAMTQKDKTTVQGVNAAELRRRLLEASVPFQKP